MNKYEPCVYFKSSEDMSEVEDTSAKLLIGASVFLEGKEWDAYRDLYHAVYCEQGQRILRDDGYLVIIQTDKYHKNRVVPFNVWLPALVEQSWGYELIDIKVWSRRSADFFQVPFSMVFVFRKRGTQLKRPDAPTHKDYFRGVWDYPQGEGGSQNSWPAQMCSMMIRAFTEPGDLIVDPFAGSALLLGMGSYMDRRCVGYEINMDLKPTIKKNLMWAPEEGLT